MIWSDIFNYDPETGVLTNKYTRGSRALINHVAGGVNSVSGYVMLMFNHRKHYAHRIIWDMENPTDQLKPGEEIDHINGIKHDNRLANLRKVCKQENQRNRPLSRNNTSGATGVTFERRTAKWDAKIVIDGVAVFIGAFRTFDEAVAARKAAEVEHGFHENHGRSYVENA